MRTTSVRAACAAGLSTVVVAAALAATASTASAATLPNELRIDGAYGSAALGQGQLVDATGSGVTVSPADNALSIFDGSGATTARIDLAGSTDNVLTAGHTYQAGSAPAAADHVALTVGLGSCNDATGELTVLDVTRDGAGTLTSFAGTLVFACDGTTANVAELRWNSSVGHVAFGGVAANATSAAKAVTVTTVATTTFGTATLGNNSTGHPNGNDPFFAFRTGTDTCSGKTVSAGGSCTIQVTSHPTDRGGNAGVLSLPTTSGDPSSVVSLTAVGLDSKGGSYTSLVPARLLDTRTTKTPFSAKQIRSLQITSKGGVPTSGVSAVVLNVTAVSPTAAGNLVVYPAGAAVPTASTVNFNAGWTGASLTTVPVGTNGQVSIRNATGSVNVIVDVVGYYRTDASTTTGAYGGYFTGTPFRLIDTRIADQGPALAPNETIPLSVDFNDPSDPFDYNSHVKALAINVTAVGPTAPGHFTTWNGAGTTPNTSTLNFTRGKTVPNMTIVPTRGCAEAWCTPGAPMFSVLNAATGSTHLIVDVAGYYDDNQTPGSLRFVPRTPKRIVDTLVSLGTTTLGAGQTKKVVAPTTVAGLDTWALVTTLTAAAPQQDSAITLWGSGARPTASNLNPAAGQYVSNMTMTDLGFANDFNLYNGSKGSTNLIVDVLGSMEHYPTLDPFSSGAAATLGSRTMGQLKVAGMEEQPAGPQVHSTSINRARRVGLIGGTRH